MPYKKDKNRRVCTKFINLNLGEGTVRQIIRYITSEQHNRNRAIRLPPPVVPIAHPCDQRMHTICAYTTSNTCPATATSESKARRHIEQEPALHHNRTVHAESATPPSIPTTTPTAHHTRTLLEKQRIFGYNLWLYTSTCTRLGRIIYEEDLRRSSKRLASHI
jgi:hypothetical protein